MQYIFILGRNFELSQAELMSVLSDEYFIEDSGHPWLLIDGPELDEQDLMTRLGGIVKIARVLEMRLDKSVILSQLEKIEAEGKLKFGFSCYDCHKSYQRLGIDIKKQLKTGDRPVRFVTSKEPTLSSVIITKEKCHDFLIIKDSIIAQTVVVQDFAWYSQRDYGRPARDTKSGTLPPKLAKIMLNLSGADEDKVILDPFCGSGTILQEALLLGFKNLIGSDKSDKAINDSKKNLDWLKQNFDIQTDSVKLFQSDVLDIAGKTDGIDAIITEPYLGPPLRGSESAGEIGSIISDLTQLYVAAFKAFKLVLSEGGMVVIIFPVFRRDSENLKLPILDKIKNLGFSQINEEELIFSRPEQKIWREILVFKL